MVVHTCDLGVLETNTRELLGDYSLSSVQGEFKASLRYLQTILLLLCFKKGKAQVWLHMHLIPALGKHRSIFVS